MRPAAVTPRAGNRMTRALLPFDQNAGMVMPLAYGGYRSFAISRTRSYRRSPRRYRTAVTPSIEFIVREAEPGDTFFIFVNGSVSVCRIAPDGRETILSILKEGDFSVRCRCSILRCARASIKTLTEVEVGAIHRQRLLDSGP